MGVAVRPLVIRHCPGPDPPQFQVSRPDQKSTDPVVVPSPLEFPVEGRPQSNLMAELRWYLEEFLDYPFSPNTDRAERVRKALEDWGRQAFDALFDHRDAALMFADATREGYENLDLQIQSDDPRVLHWPWEALRDSRASYVAVACHVERRMNRVLDPIAVSADLPRDRINILLVTARPLEHDVRYRSISRPLVELIERERIPAEVHVLRPPTLAALHDHFHQRPHFYHILHFDGHGGYASPAPHGDDRHQFRAEGTLVFEDDKGEADPITAEQLSGVLRDHAVPLVVLNACRSAMLDVRADDPFASVAAALVQAGVRGVVAMAYSLYVSGAQEFLPSFYRRLFETGDLAQAARAGRQAMFAQKRRVCARGRFELDDFLVPVLYRLNDLS